MLRWICQRSHSYERGAPIHRDPPPTLQSPLCMMCGFHVVTFSNCVTPTASHRSDQENVSEY